MTVPDPLDELEALVRGRLGSALRDKAAFERDGQRLNSQLMQGEINMGTTVLAWIARRRAGDQAATEDDEADEAADLS